MAEIWGDVTISSANVILHILSMLKLNDVDLFDPAGSSLEMRVNSIPISLWDLLRYSQAIVIKVLCHVFPENERYFAGSPRGPWQS